MTETEGEVADASKPVANPVMAPAELALVVPKLAKDSAGSEAPYTHPERRRIVLQVVGANGAAAFADEKPARREAPLSGEIPVPIYMGL